MNSAGAAAEVAVYCGIDMLHMHGGRQGQCCGGFSLDGAIDLQCCGMIYSVNGKTMDAPREMQLVTRVLAIDGRSDDGCIDPPPPPQGRASCFGAQLRGPQAEQRRESLIASSSAEFCSKTSTVPSVINPIGGCDQVNMRIHHTERQEWRGRGRTRWALGRNQLNAGGTGVAVAHDYLGVWCSAL
jgi:hypothetical protein